MPFSTKTVLLVFYMLLLITFSLVSPMFILTTINIQQQSYLEKLLICSYISIESLRLRLKVKLVFKSIFLNSFVNFGPSVRTHSSFTFLSLIIVFMSSLFSFTQSNVIYLYFVHFF